MIKQGESVFGSALFLYKKLKENVKKRNILEHTRIE